MKRMGKRVLAILCAIAIMLSFIVLPEMGLQAEATDGLTLEHMKIVLPAGSTEVERKAANELRTYIQKITGTAPSLVSESQSTGAGIYIGSTNYAYNNGVTYPTEGDANGEAWAIKAVNGSLVLCGAPERGVLYAVYHLLEDVLGVRWWNLWEEYVPTGSAVVPADYADSGVPAMEYRDVHIGKETSIDYAFFARNRVNGNATHIPASYGGQESYGYYHVHTFSRYITGEDYNAHPEWFAQIDGARDSGGQLCLTNSALKTEFASRFLAEIAKNPKAIYSVSPRDVEGKFCQCSSCKSQINTYGLSGYILSFVNEMAAAVANAGYTEAKVEMLVYWEYIDEPKGNVKPAANVQIRFADLDTDLLHSINHANNAGSKTKLQAWIDICSNDVFYWQYVIHNNINGIFPTMFHYGDDFTTLLEMGIDGWFAEQEQCINTDFWDMKLWLITKLMEKPVTGAEYTALMDEFIYGYYGDAAGEHIRDYLYYMNEKAEASDVSKNFGLGTEIIEAEWLNVQDIIAGNEYFEKAFAAAGDDAVLLRRLRAARAGLDRVIVENYAKWESQAASAGLTLPFTWREVGQRIDFTIAEQAAFRGDYDSEYQELLEYRYDTFGDDQPALPSGLSVDAGHYIEFTVRDMLAAGSGFSVVEDADSLTGMAILGDASVDSQLVLSDGYWGGFGAKSAVLYYYNGATGKSAEMKSFTASSVKVNQGYQLYSFQWTVPTTINDSDYIYMFASWGFQNRQLPGQLRVFAGQKVTVYLNMKVTGSVYNNTARYYIDRMIVVPYSQLTHSYVVSPSTYGVDCRSVCSVCGDAKLTGHNWNDGVVTVEPTVDTAGEKLFTCQTCGKTKTEQYFVETLPKELQDIDPRHIKQYDATYFTDPANMGSVLVEDADSPLGQAYYHEGLPMTAWLSTAYRNDYGSEKWLVDVEGDKIPIDGQYHFYKFTWNVPANLSTDKADIGVYHGRKWIASNEQIAQDAAAYKGKTIDFYVSIKVDGTAESTRIYIDQMLLVDSCENNRVGNSCSVCGKNFIDLSLPEELRNLDSRHIKRYDATYFTDPANMGSVLVEDADSPLGQAYYNEGLPMTAWLSTAYRNNYGSEKFLVDVAGNTVPIDGQYHFYKFTWNVPADLSTNKADIGVYHGQKWIASNEKIAQDAAAYKGKTIDFYVSIKVDGTAESTRIYIDQMLLVDSCYENWDSGVITAAPTVDAEGVMTYTCTVCGAVRTESIPKLPTPVTDWNLVLDGSIGMNFVLNVTSDEADTATVNVTVNGETTTKNVADLAADGKYVLPVELAAAQMSDSVTVTLYKGGEKISKDYSVRSYADKILGGDYTGETKNLVKAMLAYGAASQTYFGYNAENLADNGIEVTPSQVPDAGGVFEVSGSAEGLKYYGASLVYRNKIAVRIYFTGDVTSKTFTLNGEKAAPVLKEEGLYYIEAANIYPQDLAKGITVAVDGLTVTYSPLDYIIRMYMKGGDSAALVQALYGYYLAADAYIA